MGIVLLVEGWNKLFGQTLHWNYWTPVFGYQLSPEFSFMFSYKFQTVFCMIKIILAISVSCGFLIFMYGFEVKISYCTSTMYFCVYYVLLNHSGMLYTEMTKKSIWLGVIVIHML